MPAYRLRFSPLAEVEEAEAALYDSGVAPELGGRFLKALDAFYQCLRQHPQQFGFSGQTSIVRDGVLTDFPFRVVFSIQADLVFILSIRHTARRPYASD